MLGFLKKEDGIEKGDDKIYVNISNMLFIYNFESSITC